MNLKRVFVLGLALLMVCALACGCNSGSNPTDPTVTDPTGSKPTESNPTVSKPTETTPNDGKVEYVITVTDQNGAPISGVSITFCVGDTCKLPVKTNAEGVASVRYEQADYHVTVKVPEGYTCEENEFELIGETTATVVLTATPD